MSRAADRQQLEVPTRVLLLENDADDHDKDLAVVTGELRAIRNLLFGILITILASAITFGLTGLNR